MLNNIAWQEILMMGSLLLITTSCATAFGIYFLIKLPSDYFLRDGSDKLTNRRHPLIKYSVSIAKNIFGLVFFCLGIFMSLPGIPGPGLVTALIGLMLMDFPLKRDLERRIIKLPLVLPALNRLRKKFSKPPLDV